MEDVEGMVTATAPLSAWTLAAGWALDPVPALVTVVAGALYWAGVRRLAARGRMWSPWRSTAFAAGLAALVVATQSGLAAYDTVLFSTHVAQHLLLGMLSPLLLALGAPVTLALQASGRPTQVVLLRALHSRVVRWVTHPLVAGPLFGGTLFVLYFTPLYELSLGNDVLHTWIHIHFVITGALLFWVVVGLDPVAWRFPHPVRLLLVLLVLPFHAFLGAAILGADQVMAADFYVEVGRTWGASSLSDQRTGAAMLWLVGDLLGLAAGAVVVARWVAADQRATIRLDRQLDAAMSASATPGAKAT